MVSSSNTNYMVYCYWTNLLIECM
ncbi:hypothetical protein F383_33817 [Gossypium arboreum]|uniref:Uncharacterized protein n=1 Tax=Gossypium arboreum TaxID=29729 RepID=A0A0B0PL57_GOSAR|nr:hypothetical protein F383_33817 [Gossypium arboreum]